MKKIFLPKALIISPHQDDWIIGCGGLISKLSDFNWGILYFYSIKNQNEVNASEKLFGINNQWKINCPSRLTKNILNINRVFDIVNIIKEFKPKIVLIINDDGDRDHRICSDLVNEAIFLTENEKNDESIDKWEIKTILSYSVWSEIKKPSYFINIADVMTKKINAIRLHNNLSPLSRQQH